MNALLQALQDLKPLVQVLLLPPVPLMLVLVLGAALLRRHRRLGRGAFVLGLLGLWFSFTEVAADQLQQWLLGVPAALTPAQVDGLRHGAPQHSAILVLGAGVLQIAPEYDGPTLKPLTLERLRYGAWLARRSGLPLAFSGGVGWGGRPGDIGEAPVVQAVARDEFGIALRWAEGRARDTRENAAFSLPLLLQAGITRVVLVTHGHHMPRAERAFREAAAGRIELLLAPVDVRADTAYLPSEWVPSSEGFRRLRYVVYEWLGLLAGK
ncbi:YdcF family protein [Paucibacter sp. O1-1]|nr:YdcF family protein [Paucibacter sp. O1-1]MDA3830412.1 YdcF family protein [Paucibacter sp. O1-1]